MPDESLEQSFARLQRIQNRYRGMLLGQEWHDWCARTCSDIQKYVPWVWSERRGKWMQETCISALVCTDQDGRNEQRLITASGERGLFPEELNQLLSAVGYDHFPLTMTGCTSRSAASAGSNETAGSCKPSAQGSKYVGTART
jgi:hypothetical protein